MIDNEIIKKLSVVTQEEQDILNGQNDIDRKIYMNDEENIVNSKKLLADGKLISIRPHTRFIHFPKHTHDYIEVVYMCKGETKHIVDGVKIILSEGDLLFLGKGSVQEIMKSGKDDIAVNFIILPQFFDTTLTMLGDEESPLKKFILNSMKESRESCGYLHFKVKNVLPVQNLIENLLYTLISNTTNKRKLNQTTMGLLILNLLNHADKLSYNNPTDAFIIEIYKYIEENYHSGQLSDLAKKMHCDLHWLSREIKKRTTKTYTEILQEKRLSQAAFLLKNTKMKIADISSAVGYENGSYFHRLFINHFSLSPAQYRNKI